MFWRKKKPEVLPVEITDHTFNDIVPNADVPVLVDFYAPWCGPCKVLAPILTEISTDYEGKAIVAKINIDQNPQLTAHFKVKSIPTLMFFDKGRFQEKFNGLIPKPNIEEILNMYISGDYEEEE
ncbi:UNVERIFIED_CONTAM: hypothetical protein GTU68_021938 [Idotea baltica]|nr:hypothetical protein [Idotea baltica]